MLTKFIYEVLSNLNPVFSFILVYEVCMSKKLNACSCDWGVTSFSSFEILVNNMNFLIWTEYCRWCLKNLHDMKNMCNLCAYIIKWCFLGILFLSQGKTVCYIEFLEVIYFVWNWRKECLSKYIPHTLLEHAYMKTLVEAAGLTCFPSSLVYFTIIGCRTRVFDVTLKV